jgi:hypothetical protein
MNRLAKRLLVGCGVAAGLVIGFLSRSASAAASSCARWSASCGPAVSC